jgi:hypothetical protein
MDAASLRSEISAALAGDLGTYTLLNGATTPAISVRPEGQRLAAGTVASGLEVVILSEPRLSPVGAYLQQEAIREFIVFLVGWDDTANTTAAAEKLVYFFPGTIWQEIPIAKRIGPTNQARVIIQSMATPGLLPTAGPRTGASVRTLVISGTAAGSSGAALTGVSSLALTVSGTAAGTVAIAGISSQTLAITGSATGVNGSVSIGSSAATLAITASATGLVAVSGSSNQPLAIGGTASGGVRVAGISSQTLTITGSATGVIGTVAIGASSATLGITGSSAGTVRVTGASSQSLAISGSAAGTASNAIVIENALSGVADSTVGFSTIGSGVNGFYGYAKQFSRNVGESIDFAVDGVNAANIAIHRIGHYAGNRWRLVATVSNTGTNQPDTQALTNGAGARSASNWSTTASWTIPSDAVSGLYIGVVRNSSNQAQSWIPFIVREDSRTADIVIRVSDSTWGAAYNCFGTKANPLTGKSVYGNGKSGWNINDRGVQMSYDRPIVTRGETAGDNIVNHWDNHESALIDWVEKNGFNVKYISCYDLDQGLTAVGSAKVLACAGHDEYWSDGMLDNTEAFIAAGGHHVSMSANSLFWRIRWADSGRTFYCYKDTMDGPSVLRSGGGGTALDPVSWTGTWRDTRWGSRRPENLLLGATFRMNGIRDETMVVNGAANQSKPFWRNTTVASGTNLSVSQIIGFEADSLNLPNAGGVNLGSTSINIDGWYADDNGQTYNNNGTLNWGIACHYPRPEAASGLSIHFSTNQWMWGLSNYHRRGSAVNNREMRQATYNLFTDLGAIAVTKESDLTTVTPVALSTYGATRGARTGASTTTFTISGTAAGTVRVTGASSQALTITGNASGADVATGSSAQSLAITGAASGAVRVTGSSSWTFAIGGSAAGTSGGATGLLNSSTVDLAQGTTSKSASIGFTPTSGNKLVAICCAAATFTVPSGWTRLSNRVNEWASEVFTKTSDGTETTMSWTQNGARQAKVVFLEFPSTYTISLESAWSNIANIQAATSVASGTLSSPSATYIYARAKAGDDVLSASITNYTYTTTGALTELTDGRSGTSGVNNEAAHLYVGFNTFTDGPRTVSWTMTPSTANATASDALQLVAAPDSSVSIAVSPSSVNEDGVTDLVFTFTRANTVGALNVNYSIGGTATNGTDYATIASPVAFTDGSATATVTVNPTADATSESNETVTLTVTGGSGYTVGSPSVATGTITNDDGGSNATFLSLSDQYSSAGATTGGTATLATLSSGDLVIAVLQCTFITTRVTSMTCGGNAMTLVRENALGAGDNFYGLRVYALIAPSGGTSVPVTANFSPNAGFVALTAARYSGVSSATALASSCNAVGCGTLASSATNVRAQSITTGAAALIVCAGVTYDNARTQTPAGGWTKRYDGSGTPLTSFQFLIDQSGAAGTYGGAVNLSTMNAADPYLSILAAFPVT